MTQNVLDHDQQVTMIVLKEVMFIPREHSHDQVPTFTTPVTSCPELSPEELSAYASLLDNCSRDKMHIVGVTPTHSDDGVTLEVVVDICPKVYNHMIVLARIMAQAQAIVPGLLLGELQASAA